MRERWTTADLVIVSDLAPGTTGPSYEDTARASADAESIRETVGQRLASRTFVWAAPTAAAVGERCSAIALGGTTLEPSVDCALAELPSLLQGRSAFLRLTDVLLGRVPRIVFRVGHLSPWGAALKQVDAPTALIHFASTHGATIDVLRRTGSLSKAEMQNVVPTLELRVPPAVPVRAGAEEITLAVTHPLLQEGQTWTVACQLDPGIASTVKAPPALMVSPHVVREGIGPASASVTRSLHDLTGADSFLPLSHHVLDCHVTVSGLREAQASRYFPVRQAEILVVLGRSNPLFDTPPSDMVESSLRRALPPGVLPLVRPEKGDLDARLAMILRSLEALSVGSDATEAVPLAVVLHNLELLDSFRCTALKRIAASGVTVMFSTVPLTTDPDCDFLPARPERAPAAPTTASTANSPDATLTFDRTPDFRVMVDLSQLGRLRFLPVLHEPALRPSDEIKPLPDILAVQSEIAKTLIPNFSPEPPIARDADTVKDLCGLYVLTDLNARALAYGKKYDTDTQRDPGTARVGAMVLFLVYDVKQPRATAEEIARLLLHGTTVIVGRIKTPWAVGLEASLEGTKAPCRPAAPMPPNKLAAGVREWIEEHPNEARWLKPDEALGRLRVIPVDPEEKTEVDGLIKYVRGVRDTIGASRSAVVVARHWARLIDSRVAPSENEATNRPNQLATDAWAAPTVFQKLAPRNAPSVRTYATVNQSVPAVTRLEPRGLVVGEPWGAGEFVVFGYSIFEGLQSFHTPFASSAYQDNVNSRFQGPQSPNAWGIQRVVDVVRARLALEPIPRRDPMLQQVRQESSGALSLVIRQILRQSSGLRTESIETLERCASFSSACNKVVGDLMVALQSADFSRSELVFRLAPSAVAAFCGSGPEATGITSCVGKIGPVRFYVGSSGKAVAEAFADVEPAARLARVAEFTGGDYLTEGRRRIARRPAASLRTAGVLLLLMAITMLLLRRVWSGLRARLAQASAQDRERRRSRLDEPPGIVAPTGEATGAPSVLVRTGAVASMRTLEPGDPVGSVIAQDLVQMSLDDESAVVPRVVLRVEERIRKVEFVVDNGDGMRLDEVGGRAPRLLAASRVVEQLAAMAFRSGAEVRISVLCGPPGANVLGPLHSPLPAGAVAEFLHRPGQPPGSWPLVARPTSHPEGSVVVVVSDFLNIDLAGLRKLVIESEDERGIVCGVRLTAESDQWRLGVGTVRGLPMFVDRGTSTPDELKRAEREFGAEVESCFGEEQGAVCRVEVGLTPDEFVETLRFSAVGRVFA